MVYSTTLQQFFSFSVVKLSVSGSLSAFFQTTQTYTHNPAFLPLMWMDTVSHKQFLGPVTVNIPDLFGYLGCMCPCVRVGVGKKELEVLERQTKELKCGILQ